MAFSDNTGFGIDPGGGGGGGGGGDDVMGTSGINQGANQGSSGGLSGKRDEVATIGIYLGGHGPVRGVHKQPRFSGDIASSDGGGQDGPQTPLWQGPLIWLYTDHFQVSQDYFDSVRSDSEDGLVGGYEDGIARLRTVEWVGGLSGTVADGLDTFVNDGDWLGFFGNRIWDLIPGGKRKPKNGFPNGNGNGIVGIKGGGNGGIVGDVVPPRGVTIPERGRFDFDHADYDGALVGARRNAGDLGPGTKKMYDPETGTLIGEMSPEGKQGWRIDEDHVNWWDWIGGKKGSGGKYGHEYFPPDQAGPHSKYPGFAPWGD